MGTNSKDTDATDSPTAWFAAMERARQTDNYELAARAERELKRLGVTVNWARRAGTSK
jgi:hypothetical protein